MARVFLPKNKSEMDPVIEMDAILEVIQLEQVRQNQDYQYAHNMPPTHRQHPREPHQAPVSPMENELLLNNELSEQDNWYERP